MSRDVPWGSEDTFQRLVLFLHVGSGEKTQVVSLGLKHLPHCTTLPAHTTLLDLPKLFFLFVLSIPLYLLLVAFLCKLSALGRSLYVTPEYKSGHCFL